MPTILLSAADASGDAHAGALVRALRRRLGDPADLRFFGLGGAQMAAAGVELVADQRRLAVGGLFELATAVVDFVAIRRVMLKETERRRPDLAVLVDSGGFNLPLARALRRRSRARIFYFVAPQLWAWRPGRLRKLVSRSDRIAVLFPFERDFYAARDVAVDFVGHPILDSPLAEPVADDARLRAREALGLDSAACWLGLFPGSRRNEVARNLPLHLAAFERWCRARSDGDRARAVVALAPTLDAPWLRAELRRANRRGPIGPDRVELLPVSRALLDAIDLALVKPGTTTLELMLRGCPMVVAARAHPLTAAWAARALRVDWLALPNLIPGEAIVPEFLQREARPDRIAQALAAISGDTGSGSGSGSTSAQRQRAGFARARRLLGQPGATQRAAGIAEELLLGERESASEG